MCYSAQIKEEYDKYVRAYGSRLTLREYVQIFWHRQQGAKLKIPRAIELDFLRHEARTDEGREIQRLIREHDATEIAKLEQEVFKQKKRQSDAQRILQTKTTKKAQEDLRISTDKIEWALGKLGDLKRSETKEKDRRIFTGWYTRVMVSEGGQRMLKPMRYQCRPEGVPSNYDIRFPGTYNASMSTMSSNARITSPSASGQVRTPAMEPIQHAGATATRSTAGSTALLAFAVCRGPFAFASEWQHSRDGFCRV